MSEPSVDVVNAEDRVVAVVPGSVCARFVDVLEGLVREDLRRNGTAIDPQLARLLIELRETGAAWRQFHAATSDATSDGCVEDFRSVTLELVTTKEAAGMIGTSTRNVVDLIGRGLVTPCSS